MDINNIQLTDVLDAQDVNKVKWESDDEKVIRFDVLRGVSTADSELFGRYVTNRLTPIESGQYNYKYIPCFVEVEALMAAEILCPSMLVGSSNHCQLIGFGDAFGILIIGSELSKRIPYLALGVNHPDDDVEEGDGYTLSTYEQVQFMKFDPKILEALDLKTMTVSKNPFSPLNAEDAYLAVNFAKFEENPDDDE